MSNNPRELNLEGVAPVIEGEPRPSKTAGPVRLTTRRLVMIRNALTSLGMLAAMPVLAATAALVAPPNSVAATLRVSPMPGHSQLVKLGVLTGQ